MPKCVHCNSCLELLVLEGAVFNYCSLCTRFYNLITGKEEDLLATAYLIKHNEKEYLLLGRVSENVETLEDELKEMFPDIEVEILKLPVLKTKKEIANKILDNL